MKKEAAHPHSGGPHYSLTQIFASSAQNWLTVLKNDKRFIVSASGKAEKAVNLILGTAV